MSWCNLNGRWRSHETWKTIYLLFLGQVVSFVLALGSFTSSLIADLGVDAPLTQTLFPYFFLASVYGSILLYRRKRLLVSWYWYLLLGFVDVQGNYLVNKAYQFSSITSVTLLDCWTIPWVMILTWFFLGTRYSLWQLFGAAICIIGLGLVFLSDAGVGGGDGSKPLLGDVLVIAGTVFYAMSNVGEILAFAGYAVSTFMFYTVAPFVLQLSGATMFNLSILTSDMWAVVIRIFFYHQQVDWLYYLSFAIVCIGLVIYSTTEKNYVPVPAIEDGNSNTQYEVLTEEIEATRNESLVS